ncbi:MAG TPA: tRNA (uridine(34)/cytosine(34)/5-carboxymethylaminomethyluridine(34)-2'-O)-methyltransferase TrmL [Clostridia bacterium]|nr:tRNA (uridine(34)/cytosine(34)/5-carboxymethylaminomethyluridine(34)-2'-O)-methyltransferase TrmL [Clostridia bacterium]HRU84622.1 tRNA (uridine(34)/cytosine(34)/5-carboxymethylaminomethyluridine(34)-2'-O)-methyltransferase TrmL [Eubacteriales bacterium]
MDIVLVEPEIPQNTGNIVRTAAATASRLHLVGPLGFDISDKALKRAGLDYWHLADIVVYDSLDEFFEKNTGGRFFYLSTKAARRYDEIEYRPSDYLVFGKETKGLPEELLYKNYDRTARIPMIEDSRSLNLSNAVAIVLYEALRQTGFLGLKACGKLAKF